MTTKLQDKILYLADTPLCDIVASAKVFRSNDKATELDKLPGWDKGEWCRLSGFASVRPFPKHGHGLHITAGKALLDFFRSGAVLHTRDTMNVCFVQREDGVLVYLQHGVISGSYWLCLVPLDVWGEFLRENNVELLGEDQ